MTTPVLRGFWYTVLGGNEYGDIYSGGVATYPFEDPMAIYDATANKTFFVFVGTDQTRSVLRNEISYLDHATGKITELTTVRQHAEGFLDPHASPCISMDSDGYIYVMCSARGDETAQFYKSSSPRDISAFTMIYEAANIHYPHVYYKAGSGFFMFYTVYGPGSLGRQLYFSTSTDGVTWAAASEIAYFGGHYSAAWFDGTTLHTVFNYHNADVYNRFNLYYAKSDDFGATWKNYDGDALTLPLAATSNDALEYDTETGGYRVLASSIRAEANGDPVILYLSAPVDADEPGPCTPSRTLYVMCRDNGAWVHRAVCTLYHSFSYSAFNIEASGTWRVYAHGVQGPEPWGTGGEVVMYTSTDRGASWTSKQLTTNSKYNHSSWLKYAVNAHNDFCCFWSDGDTDAQSKSVLYYASADGEVTAMSAGYTPAYACCPGSSGLDIKTGTPTMTIDADSIATFSAAQTNALMGVGVAISYNDGAPKKCYIKAAGKINTTQWRVVGPTGDVVAACTDASVTSIGFDYESLSAAIAGCVDADHINNTSLVAADVTELHLPQYCLQDTYTADTTATTISGITRDADHRIKIYCPSNTTTECNTSMKPATAKWDATKPRFETDGTAVITVSNLVGNASFEDFYDLQIYNTEPDATAAYGIYIDREASQPTFKRCIFRFDHAAALRIAIFLNRGTTIATVTDNIGFVKGGVGSVGSSFVRITNAAGRADVYGNTAYSFQIPIYCAADATAGYERTAKNNIFLSNTGVLTRVNTHDYNTYDLNESETNGTLTTQEDAVIFTGYDASNLENTEWTIRRSADAFGKGTNIGLNYRGDFLHSDNWRPQGAAWDCGAVEIQVPTSGAMGLGLGTTGLLLRGM